MLPATAIAAFAQVRSKHAKNYNGATYGFVGSRTPDGLVNLGCRVVLATSMPAGWSFHAESDSVLVERGWLERSDVDRLESDLTIGEFALCGHRVLLCPPGQAGALDFQFNENSLGTRSLIGWPAWGLVAIRNDSAPSIVGAVTFDRLQRRLPRDATHHFSDWDRVATFLCEGGRPFEIGFRSLVILGIYAPLAARLERVDLTTSKISVTVRSQIDPVANELAIVLEDKSGGARTFGASQWEHQQDDLWEVRGRLDRAPCDVLLLASQVTIDGYKTAEPQLQGDAVPSRGVGGKEAWVIWKGIGEWARRFRTRRLQSMWNKVIVAVLSTLVATAVMSALNRGARPLVRFFAVGRGHPPTPPKEFVRDVGESVNAGGSPQTIASWHCDDNAGWSVTDETPSHLDGQMRGGAGWGAPFRGRGGIQFTGATQVIEFPGRVTSDLPRGRIECAFKWSGRVVDTEPWIFDQFLPPSASNLGLAISKRCTATAQGCTQWHLWFTMDRVFVASGSTIIRPGRWYQVACTWDGSEACIYLDGVLDGRGATGLFPGNTTNPLVFGSSAGGADGTSQFVGSVDEIRLMRAP